MRAAAFLLLFAAALLFTTVASETSFDQDLDLLDATMSEVHSISAAADADEPVTSLAEIEEAEEASGADDVVPEQMDDDEDEDEEGQDAGDDDEDEDAEEDEEDEDEGQDASTLTQALKTASALETADDEEQDVEEQDNEGDDDEEDEDEDEDVDENDDPDAAAEPADENPADGDAAANMGPNGPEDSAAVPDVEGVPTGMGNDTPADDDDNKSDEEDDKKEDDDDDDNKSDEEDDKKADDDDDDNKSDEDEDDKDHEKKHHLAGHRGRKLHKETKEVDSVFAGAKAVTGNNDDDVSKTVAEQEADAPWGVREQLAELRSQNAKLKQMLNRAVVTEEKLSEIVRSDQGTPVTGFDKVFGGQRTNAAAGVFGQNNQAAAPTKLVQQGVTASIEDGDDDEDDEEDAYTEDIQTGSGDNEYDRIWASVSN